MRGGDDHLAPLGSPGMLIFHFSLSGTNIEKAIDLPSGDQRTLRGVSVTWVTCVAGLGTSIQRTKICVPFGSPSASYNSRFPSSDQRGLEPLTRNRCSAPSALTSHTSDSHLSSAVLTRWRV